MSSLVVVATTTPAAAHPGHPGEAHEPVVLYHETFDSAAPPMMLDEYVRADGGRYRADPQIRSLAERLGQLNGTEPAADNVAVSAYTAGDPGVAQPVQFATVEPIDPCEADGDIGTFTSDTGILFTGSQVGIEMTNATGSGIGNDAAFDDIRCSLPTGGETRIRLEFVESGTETLFPLHAAFVTSDLDVTEVAVFDAADLSGYTLPVDSWVTVTESAGSVAFIGAGTGDFDPRASFQTLFEGVSAFETTWSGFAGSGFQLNGNGSQVFPPQCWEADKTVISEGTPAPGAVVTYQVVLTNTGDDDLASLRAVDHLDEVLAHAAWVGDQVASAGTLVFDPAEETLTWTGDLPVGAPAASPTLPR